MLDVLDGIDGYPISIVEEMVFEDESSDGADGSVLRGELSEGKGEVVCVVGDL